jgi:hypothetical protein
VAAREPWWLDSRRLADQPRDKLAERCAVYSGRWRQPERKWFRQTADLVGKFRNLNGKPPRTGVTCAQTDLRCHFFDPSVMRIAFIHQRNADRCVKLCRQVFVQTCHRLAAHLGFTSN